MDKIRQISSLSQSVAAAPTTPQYRADKPFQLFLNDAVAKQPAVQPLPAPPPGAMQQALSPMGQMRYSEMVAQVLNQEELDRLDKRRKRIDPVQPAQVMVVAPGGTLVPASADGVVPFQVFIDKAVQSLQNVSDLEYRVNDLTQQYIDGKISIDEVSIESQKLNLAITFATTLITTVSQTLKELTQIPV